MKNICGFLIARKPDQNFDEASIFPYFLSNSPPCIKGICYSGVSRVPWYELDEMFYAGVLPEQLIEIRSDLIELNQPNLDVLLMKDIDAAKTVLKYSNSIQDRYEIIALFSDKLANLKDSFNTDIDMKWLGFDIYYSGYGSQIKEGVFNKGLLFSDFVDKLNSNGLFDNDKKLIEDYTERYNKVDTDNELEIMSGLSSELRDVIRVAKVA